MFSQHELDSFFNARNHGFEVFFSQVFYDLLILSDYSESLAVDYIMDKHFSIIKLAFFINYTHSQIRLNPSNATLSFFNRRSGFNLVRNTLSIIILSGFLIEFLQRFFLFILTS